MRILQTNGPHTTAQKELKYRHRAAYKRLNDTGLEEIERQNDVIVEERMRDDLNHQLRLLKIEQQREMELLIREQEDEIRQTGIDPDAEPRRRQAEENRLRNEMARARMVERMALIRNNNQNNEIANFIQNVNVIRAGGQVQQRGELGNFAHDNQNVHTTAAVQQTKDMVQKILTIQVPAEYRWNVSECSKTPGDIIMCCKLTPKGAWQMASKYCQDEDIYEMGKGIYGKVLDGVWQYVMKSTDKEDLCKILKQEMEDNIGMCAQGNLTRLCNILAGYMEGIGVQESPSEILGRKLPMLAGIENVEERLAEAHKLLVELAIPQEQWLSWVEPLVDSGTVFFRANAGGEVIGLMVV